MQDLIHDKSMEYHDEAQVLRKFMKAAGIEIERYFIHSISNPDNATTDCRIAIDFFERDANKVVTLLEDLDYKDYRIENPITIRKYGIARLKIGILVK